MLHIGARVSRSQASHSQAAPLQVGDDVDVGRATAHRAVAVDTAVAEHRLPVAAHGLVPRRILAVDVHEQPDDVVAGAQARGDVVGVGALIVRIAARRSAPDEGAIDED
jgi:hypothetical protein